MVRSSKSAWVLSLLVHNLFQELLLGNIDFTKVNVEYNQSRTQQVWAYNNLMNESHLWAEQKINDKEKKQWGEGCFVLFFCLSKNTAKHWIIADEAQTQTPVDTGF